MKIVTHAIFVFSLCCTALQGGMAQSEPSAFKVGVILCLSGACAEPGNNALKGVQIAADEINAAGGILGKSVSLLVEDTREAESGANSVGAYRKLELIPNVHYIIGPTWSIGGLPLAPIISKRSDLIAVSPSLGLADYNEAGDNIFNLWPHDSYSTEVLAKYAIERGWRKAAVLSCQGPWESVQAKVFAEAYKKLGGKIVAFEEPLGDRTDLRMEILRIKGQNPDVVFMSNYQQMDIAAREFRKLKFTAAKLAILMDETRLKNSEGALDGTIFARYPDPSDGFAKKFTERFGERPGIAADTGYDTMYAIARAIEEVKTFDVKIVKKKLLELKFVGASGQIAFDTKGGVVKRPELWVVRDSKQVFLAAAP